jgi:hypothetical protein
VALSCWCYQSSVNWEELLISTKSFEISKHVVWEAYERVKANQGAAGVDNESISQFEQHHKRNLYKVWDRLSSGSTFPPPVKQVELPKKSGGKRCLGVPTVSDRIAQTVVKLTMEPLVEPRSIQIHPVIVGAVCPWSSKDHTGAMLAVRLGGGVRYPGRVR